MNTRYFHDPSYQSRIPRFPPNSPLVKPRATQEPDKQPSTAQIVRSQMRRDASERIKRGEQLYAAQHRMGVGCGSSIPSYEPGVPGRDSLKDVKDDATPECSELCQVCWGTMNRSTRMASPCKLPCGHPIHFHCVARLPNWKDDGSMAYLCKTCKILCRNCSILPNSHGEGQDSKPSSLNPRIVAKREGSSEQHMLNGRAVSETTKVEPQAGRIPQHSSRRYSAHQPFLPNHASGTDCSIYPILPATSTSTTSSASPRKSECETGKCVAKIQVVESGDFKNTEEMATINIGLPQTSNGKGHRLGSKGDEADSVSEAPAAAQAGAAAIRYAYIKALQPLYCTNTC